MSKIKVVFVQTVIVSTAILAVLGIKCMLIYFRYGISDVSWTWYIPLSIIITGFLCSLPTLLLMSADNENGKVMWLRIALHFVCLGAIVSLSGFLFSWYKSVQEYLSVILIYVLIYVFAWFVTAWLAKSDEKKINKAIEEYRDKE